MPFLRQSTIQTIRFGPFLDAADGVTEEESLTITQTLRRLSKDGGDFAQSGETGNSTHDENGWYFDDLTAADTNTVGELILYVQDPTNHLPVWVRWWVIEEAVYDAIYGAAAAGPLQGTTPGNTLDVAATGEAGLDLDNTVGTLDAAQIGTDAITSAKIAANAIGASELATDAIGAAQLAADAVDEIWDEVLTGATHNVVNSAGRRIRALQEFQGYALGAVWIDTVNGIAGTSDFENGTVNNPVLTLADAITLASSLNLKRFVITPGSSITFAEAHTDELWVGTSWTLALGTQDCSKTTISGAAISGTATSPTGEIHLDECEVGTTTIGQTHFRNCTFDATVTLSAAAIYLFENCSLGGTSCIIDLGAAVGNTHVDISRWSGSLELQNVGQTGTDAVDLDGAGALTINVNCVGGTIDIHGFWDITDNGSSTVSRAGITGDVTSILGDTAGIAGSAMRGTDSASTHAAADVARLVNPQKNQAFSDITFEMYDSTDHNPSTGLTVTGERSIDGGAYVAVDGTIAEISDGTYQFDALAADMNGDLIAFKFTSAGADDTFVHVKTAA